MEIEATKYWVATRRCGLDSAVLVGLLSLLLWPTSPVMGQSPTDSLREKLILSRPVMVIAPGTQVLARSDAALWNRQVLVANAKINSGDVQALSEVILDAATKCSLTLMASVEKSNQPKVTEQSVYRLSKFGVGYSSIGHSANGSSGRVIISSDTALDLGVDLGFISRQVLRANETQLANVRVVAKTDQLAIFDAPSVMLRQGVHRKYMTRHLVFIDASSGEGTMMVWLLIPPSKEKEGMAIINKPIRVTKWGTTETRKIHVDEDEFSLLGVPGELAFALEDLPPGIDVKWTKRAAKFAGRKSLTRGQVDELFDAMRGATLMGK